jgi:hypothetical protein
MREKYVVGSALALLGGCGFANDSGDEELRGQSGYSDVPTFDTVPNFHPLRPYAEMRGMILTVGSGDKVHMAVADNRSGNVALAFHPGTGPDFATPRPEEARFYKVTTTGLLAVNNVQWPDANTGVLELVYSAKQNDYRAAGLSRRMDGSGRFGEIRSNLTGVPGPFNGNMAELGWSYNAASSATRDVFVVNRTGTSAGIAVGEVDSRGVRVKTSNIFVPRASDGCLEVGGVWTNGYYTFTGLVGKRRTNNGQRELLKGFLTYFNIARDQELLSSEFDIAVGAKEDVVPFMMCTDYKFQMLGVFSEVKQAPPLGGRAAAVVWRNQESRRLPVKSNITYWGSKDPSVTHELPEGVEAIAPYATDRWGALAIRQDIIHPLFHQVVFLLLDTDGSIEEELVLSEDNVDPEYGLSRPTPPRNVALVNVGGNFFVASWVTKDYQVKAVAIAIVYK